MQLLVKHSAIKSKVIGGRLSVLAGLLGLIALFPIQLVLAAGISSQSELASSGANPLGSGAIVSPTLANGRQAHRFLKAPPIHYLVYGRAGEPLQIIDSDGFLTGFITDVVNEVFEQSDITIIPIIKPIIRIKREMIQGHAKRWIAYALRSWESEGVWSNVSFARFASVDLLPYHLSLGYKKSSGDIDLQQLSQQGVVWIQGYRYPGTQALSDRYQFEFQRAKSHAAMLKMVEAGRVGFFMEHAPRMRHIMNKLEVDKNSYEFYSLAQEVPSTSITLLMSNDLGPEVIAFVNRRLTEMSRSGRIQELSHRYALGG